MGADRLDMENKKYGRQLHIARGLDAGHDCRDKQIGRGRIKRSRLRGVKPSSPRHGLAVPSHRQRLQLSLLLATGKKPPLVSKPTGWVRLFTGIYAWEVRLSTEYGVLAWLRPGHMHADVMADGMTVDSDTGQPWNLGMHIGGSKEHRLTP